MQKAITGLLSKLDLTEIFRDKGGLRKWSAKRTIGGVIVTYALTSMNGAIEWNGVVLCVVGIVPLCLSFFEGR
ncbi:MAG: hypothetical protein CMC15_13540 [Flavobacteriaceae bacterium]|nr:hypothetical protein [Flavobacteriaceae bacterium]|tara:strand:- start:1671 stop:1889 length:219 start_codon:yes stop_codon:yes gene_type:complete